MMTEQTKQDLTERCERTRADIASLLDWMECELEKDEAGAPTWATLGSLDHVRSDLKNVLTFFSGVETAEIERSLDELHM